MSSASTITNHRVLRAAAAISSNTKPYQAPANGAGLARYCASCGESNPAGAKFCLNCGTPQGDHCSTCGTPVVTGSKFCSHCGARLSQTGAALPQPAALSQQPPLSPNFRSRLPAAQARKITTASLGRKGERREITVLFLDIANFTATSTMLDSEEVYLFIDEAMLLLANVIQKYEGTIDKFTGDGLMALFGAPVAHEDDPVRAVRAGLEMQTVLQPLQLQLKEKYGFELKTRIGINTGPAIAGKLGSNLHMEYTVIGDTVNLAARLESAAQPDTVLVSEKTYRRTWPLFDYQTLPPVNAKGFAEAVPAFRPLGLRQEPQSLRGLPGLQTPMIGRQAELWQLQAAFATVQEGQAPIALITADAGVGKSRLIAEFQRGLAGSGARIIQTGCQAYTSATPLWFVTQLLGQIVGLAEADSKESQCQTLQNYLARQNLVDSEISPYLRQLLDCQQLDPELEAWLAYMDPAMLQKQTHSALRQLLLSEAQQGPTIFIFEDLHWLDPASKEFLKYFIQSTTDESFMMLLVSRQAERETSLEGLVAAAHASGRLLDLQLHALSIPEGQQLVGQLISQPTPEAENLRDKIVDRAGGNPLYIEEMVRMLIEQGGVTRQADCWAFTATAHDIIRSVPDTVKGLILARFDQLPASVRQTLQCAAVLGNTFPVELLVSLDDINSEAIPFHFEELESRQFIVAGPGGSGARYSFNHSLMQETIYSTLLKQDCRRIHTQAAEAIEKQLDWHPDERAEALAYHYFESETPAKATSYLLASAEKAARRCDNETAAEQYRRAMTLLPAQPDGNDHSFYQVRIGLGAALKFTGKFTEAGQALLEALRYLWPSTAYPASNALWPLLVESLQQLADIRQREGVYDAALSYLEAALQVLGEEGAQAQPHLWRALLDRLAWIRFRQGQLDEAYNLAQAVVADAQESSAIEPVKLASLFNTLGGVSWQLGDLDQAVTFVEKSLSLYQDIGYTWGVAIAHGNLGVLHDVQGQWARAMERYQRAYELHQITGDLQNQANNLDNLGTLCMTMGDLENAQEYLGRGLAVRQRLGDAWGTAQSQVNLANLALIQGLWPEATQSAGRALELADTVGSAELQIHARWLLAIAQAKGQNDVEAGLMLARQALDKARTDGLSEKETECLRALGVIYAHLGDYVSAGALLRQSIALARTHNDPYREGLALLELARATYHERVPAGHAAPDPTQALAALAQAIEKFERLGAAHDLNQAKILLQKIRGQT